MPDKNKLVYSKDLDQTYVLTPDGKQSLGTVEGNQLNNPLLYQSNAADIQNIEPVNDPRVGIKQMEKDFVTNMASAAPSMIPGIGPVARIAGSLGLGTAVDQLLNKDRPIEHSLGQAAFNTGVGEVGSFLTANRPSFEIPGMRTTSQSTLERGPTLSERTLSSKRNSSLVRDALNELQSSGESTGRVSTTGSAAGKSASTSIRQPYQGEMTVDMQALNDRIAKLKSIEPKNKSQATQVNNLIDKLEESLQAEAVLSEGTITKTSGTSEGSRASSSSSSSSSSRTGKSESHSASTGSGESTGTSQGMSQPGIATRTTSSVTTGGSKLERLIHAIHFTPNGEPLTPLQRVLLSLGFNTLADTTVNAPNQGKR